jgi:predicted transcriptional regulator
MKPEQQSSMQTSLISEITEKNLMITLEEIKFEILQLNKKLEGVTTRLDIITDLLLPEEESELVEYLQQTMNAVISQDKKKNGIPISRHDLAEELDIHVNTAYIRLEKLVKMKKLNKFYGRELGRIESKEKKAVFYGLFRTLYNRTYLEELEKKNDIAYRIAVSLLQEQPLSEKELVGNSSITKTEIEEGFNYLLNRGLIIQEVKQEVAQYRIRKIESMADKSNY